MDIIVDVIVIVNSFFDLELHAIDYFISSAQLMK